MAIPQSPQTAGMRSWRQAREKGSALYKFRYVNRERDFDPDWQGFAASVLRDSIAYFASPCDLNDPWEGRPHFLVPQCSFDADEARPYIESFVALQEQEKRNEAIEWLRNVGFEEATRVMQDHFYRSNRPFGVFSVAGNGVHPLLWSYYANGYRGYCWVIDQTLEPFATASQVTYQSACPSIDWSRWHEGDHAQLLKLSLLTKASYWSHEDEYRIVLRREAWKETEIVPHNGRGPAPAGRYVRIPPRALVGVILGGGMSEEDMRDLLRIVERYRPDLSVFKQGIHRRHYEICIEQLTPSERARMFSP